MDRGHADRLRRIALALIIYSYRRFHDDDNAVEELSRKIEESDRRRASRSDKGTDSRSGDPVR